MAALLAHEKAQGLYLEAWKAEPDRPRLTHRELECATWLAAGKTSAEVGEILSISDQTVISHIKSAMTKTGTFTRAHLVARLLAAGQIAL